MLIFGFLDGFFFSLFLLLALMVFVVCWIGKTAIGSPLKALSWANTLHGILRGFTGHQDDGK